MLIDVVGNLVVILLIGAVFFGYTQYQARQGKAVHVGNKKVN